MSERVKPAAVDWLKLAGLLLAIVVVGLDITVMRGKNIKLLNSIETLRIEADTKVKAAELKAKEEVERSVQQVKAADKRILEARKKSQAAEAEAREKVRTMQMEQQAKIAELKESYEKRIREMRDEFNDRLNRSRSVQKSTPRQVNDTPNTVRCNKCGGGGMVTVKERCATCNGRGKIQQESRGTRRGPYSTSTSISMVTVDCPDCLPGSFKGGGSKGYTIERKPCPKCNGTGELPSK